MDEQRAERIREHCNEVAIWSEIFEAFSQKFPALTSSLCGYYTEADKHAIQNRDN